MRIIWTPEALQDREKIWGYIATDNRRAAIKMDKLFSQVVAKLSAHPLSGYSGKISGTRELIPHKSYRLIYEINHQTVWILALIHTAKQWPPAQ